MKKTVEVTVNIAVARKMLGVAGFSLEELREATDDEIFGKVLDQIVCYGASFEVKG